MAKVYVVLCGLLVVGFSHAGIKKKTEKKDYNDHHCIRPCVEGEKPRVCEYDWTLELYFTMSGACFDCPFNVTDCYRPYCVTGAGISRGIVTANRQLPGPTIQVCEGDEIVVNVHNHMVNSEATTIHWHGALQRGSQHMDGTSLVTQCPISPMSAFQYRFLAKDPGTHWWHSHAGFQRADGLFGSLVIRQTPSRDPHSALYDYDLPEHVITVTDWLDELTANNFAYHMHDNGHNFPPTLLINGMGACQMFTHPDTGEEVYTPHAEFKVKPSKRYRFRVISAAVLDCPIQVSVDNHKLQVIASDGGNFDPIMVDSFNIFAGERFDFVLTADRTAELKNHWIRMRGLADCRFRKSHQVAVLRYEGAPPGLPEEPVSYKAGHRKGKELNPWNTKATKSKVAIEELNATEEDKDDVLKAEPDKRYHLAMDFYRTDNFHYEIPGSVMTHQMSHGSHHMAHDSHGVSHGSHHMAHDSHGVSHDSHTMSLDSHTGLDDFHMMAHDSHPMSHDSHTKSHDAHATVHKSRKKRHESQHHDHGHHHSTTNNSSHGQSPRDHHTSSHNHRKSPHHAHKASHEHQHKSSDNSHNPSHGRHKSSHDHSSSHDHHMPSHDHHMPSHDHHMSSHQHHMSSHASDHMAEGAHHAGGDAHAHHRMHLFSPQINRISYSMPPVPPLTQPEDMDEDWFCDEDTTNADCAHEFCECTHRLHVAVGEVVELVIIDEGVTFDISHPMHLHGFKFRVIGTGKLNTSTSREEVMALDRAGLIPRKLKRAPIKDTVAVPDGGYAIVRFKADNPGIWLMHCHTVFHVEIGMALVIQVGNKSELPPRPKNFPTCGHWKSEGLEVGEQSYIGRQITCESSSAWGPSYSIFSVVLCILSLQLVRAN